MIAIEQIWKRINVYSGETFIQIRVGEFSFRRGVYMLPAPNHKHLAR